MGGRRERGKEALGASCDSARLLACRVSTSGAVLNGCGKGRSATGLSRVPCALGLVGCSAR